MRAQKPELVTAPANPLLLLDEVKEFLRIEVDDTDEDVVLNTLIDSATAQLDGHRGMLGRALLTQTWKQCFDDFPDRSWIMLPVGPIQSVTSGAYIDQQGGNQQFDAFHLVDWPLGPAIQLEDGATWPSTATRPDAITVTWEAGFGDSASDVPAMIRTAALQLVAHLYAHREAVSEGVSVPLPYGLEHIIATQRDFGG